MDERLRDDDDRVLSREDAADFLGLSSATLATWESRQKGRIPIVRYSARRVGYRLGDLRAYIASCRGGAR